MPEARVIPLRPDDDEPYVPPAAAPGWEDQLAGGLDFLRRRLTGDYETDEFGFDPDLDRPRAAAAAAAAVPAVVPGRDPGPGERARRPAARWSWPTTRARSRSTR